ncbi:hypothetical protein F441_00578 [Phytophthora nicotianae CJ01A1]|nr:hypothetical protein L915_00551 [Phytophthora nicotianae]ETP26833.1 hypothetical protein F441_00578 [Phytophthora nicotianae CJ01A1]
MHMLFTVLLLIGVFQVGVNAVSIPQFHAKPVKIGGYLSPDKEESTAPRKLRLTSEERANTLGLSKLADLGMKISKLRKIDIKLADKIVIWAGRNPEYLFKNLEVKPGAMFDEGRSSQVCDAQSRDSIAISKNNPDLKDFAVAVENYQFKVWVSRKETPESIATLFGIQNQGLLPKQKALGNEILKGFTHAFEVAI